MIPPVLRQSTRPQRHRPVDLTALTSHSLISIIITIESKKEALKTVAALRSTCSTTKASIDHNVGFGIPFLKFWGINLKREAWKKQLNEMNWFRVFHNFYVEPHTIVAFDYSFSMDETLFSTARTHIDVALSILKDSYIRQETKLRSEMTIYLFGSEVTEFRVKKEKHFKSLIKKIAQRELEGRSSSQIELVFDAIFRSETSPIGKNSFGRSTAIQIISDNCYHLEALQSSIAELNTHANSRASKNNSHNIRFSTTLESEINRMVYEIAENLINPRLKRKISLILDAEHEAKRQKVPEEDLLSSEISFGYQADNDSLASRPGTPTFFVDPPLPPDNAGDFNNLI